MWTKNSNGALQQLHEVWTKNIKRSPAEEDDVEMTGVDEDSFEKLVADAPCQ